MGFSMKIVAALFFAMLEKPHHLPKDPEYLLELPVRVLHYEIEYLDLATVVQSRS
jgi:hypothetical protein